MRPITRTMICALAAAAMSAPAFAAVNSYLELPPIKGESAAKSAPAKQLEILSWSWGATNAGRVNLNSSKSNANREIAGKRQHGWVTVSKALDRGSLRVKVKFPWLDCKAGAAFPDAVLQNDAGRYEFKEVMITSCAPDSVSLDYARLRESPTRPSPK